jgi:hypothetical protein
MTRTALLLTFFFTLAIASESPPVVTCLPRDAAVIVVLPDLVRTRQRIVSSIYARMPAERLTELATRIDDFLAPIGITLSDCACIESIGFAIDGIDTYVIAAIKVSDHGTAMRLILDHVGATKLPDEDQCHRWLLGTIGIRECDDLWIAENRPEIRKMNRCDGIGFDTEVDLESRIRWDRFPSASDTSAYPNASLRMKVDKGQGLLVTGWTEEVEADMALLSPRQLQRRAKNQLSAVWRLDPLQLAHYMRLASMEVLFDSLELNGGPSLEEFARACSASASLDGEPYDGGMALTLRVPCGKAMSDRVISAWAAATKTAAIDPLQRSWRGRPISIRSMPSGLVFSTNTGAGLPLETSQSDLPSELLGRYEAATVRDDIKLISTLLFDEADEPVFQQLIGALAVPSILEMRRAGDGYLVNSTGIYGGPLIEAAFTATMMKLCVMMTGVEGQVENAQSHWELTAVALRAELGKFSGHTEAPATPAIINPGQP